MAHPLELAARPANDIGIDPSQGRSQLRFVKVAVVADPAADARVVRRGQLSQAFVAALAATATDVPPRGRAGRRGRNPT